MTTPYPPPPPRPNAMGRIALGIGIVGFVLGCIPRTLTAGWIALGTAFVLGFVGLLQSGQTKKSSVTAIIVSAAGMLASASIVAFGVAQIIFEVFAKVLGAIADGSGQR